MASLQRGALYILLLGVSLLASTCAARGQEPTECSADVDHPIKVCLKAPGLIFDRCSKALKLDFFVDLLDIDSSYQYEVHIFKVQDGGNRVEVQQYKATEWQKPSRLHLPPPDLPAFRIASQRKNEIDGEYSAEVKVWLKQTDQADPAPVSEGSTSLSVDFHRHIRAIVMGVSKYKYGSHAEKIEDRLIVDLNYASHDAEQFFQLLNEVFPGNDEEFSIALLQDATAKKDDLVTALNGLSPDNVCAGDLVIFYFSGHTLIHPGLRARYVGTSDFDPRRPFDGYSYMQLIQALEATNAEKLIILDSCYSGLTETAGASEHDATAKGSAAVSASGSKLQVISDFGQVVQNSNIAMDADAVQAVKGEIALLSYPDESIALYSAAGSNVPALEVPISQTPLSDDGRHVLLPGEQTNLALSTGHGLFTYFLLRALEAQMSKSHLHSDFAEDGDASKIWSNHPSCNLDFGAAYAEARVAINRLSAWRALKQID
jgi:hypothetical protein